MRVEVPTNPSDLLDLAAKIRDKHTQDGDASLLKPLKVEVVSPSIDEANGHDDRAASLRKQAEKETEARDVMLEPIRKFVRQSRDLLLGVYADNPHTLGDWGFTVDESPRGGNAPTPAPK